MCQPADENADVRSAGAPETSGPVATAAASVPGFSAVRVGDVTVTAVYDGFVTVDLHANLIGVSPHELEDTLRRSYRSTPITLSVNTYVVDTATERVIVDVGGGALMGPGAGRLPANLAAAGLAPGDIDRVLLTHLNGDHMGGLIVEGEPFFPRAEVVVGEADAALWLDPDNRAGVAEDLRSTFDDAARMVAPYRQTGRLRTARPGAEVAPGVRAVSTPGHSPGHTSFMIESRGERMLVWGDIIHVASVQFPRPEIAIRFDVDSPTAIRTRRAVLADAAAGRFLVAGAHLPFPGIGHISARDGAAGGAYEYVPIDLAPGAVGVGA